MKNKRLLQIVVPLVILIAIGGVWLLKDRAMGPRGDEMLPTDPEAAMEIQEVDIKALAAKGLPVMVDFGADACVPCIEMAPALRAIYTQSQGKATVHFVDVWKHEAAAEGFPVRVIPTQLFVNPDGTPYQPSETIASKIPFTQYSHKDSGEVVFTVHEGGLTEEQMKQIFSDMGVDLG